ncbi:MAG TPA: SGNH hydrolase domain-containing protein [Acidimicrobiales bacterium]|jgi:hypothetical protein|nr:SGNH hydrolase domain-containing protein [Acidimicrobiales bacterium]
MLRHLARLTAGAGSLVVAFALSASAAPLPGPGTAAQVAKLVATANRIEVLPNNLVPSLPQAGNDDAVAYYPVTEPGCTSRTQCVFGDLHGTHTVVLFGDSHALMWLTSFVPIAVKYRFRLVLLWKASCPATDVSVWDPVANSISRSCNSYRTAEEGLIHKLNPSLVLLASRNTDITGAGNKPISAPTWRAGLEATITAVRTRTTRVAVVGDIIPFNAVLPDCLAANPSHVQLCSVTNPNPKVTNHFSDDLAAAKAARVPYVNPQRWLCTSVCSPVIGNMISYYNNQHVSATYAAFLSGVWATALRPLLPR